MTSAIVIRHLTEELAPPTVYLNEPTPNNSGGGGVHLDLCCRFSGNVKICGTFGWKQPVKQCYCEF